MGVLDLPYKDRPEDIKERIRERQRLNNKTEHHKKWRWDNRRDIKKKALYHYGRKCACCGEKNIGFLTLDHPQGGGTRQRDDLGKKGASFYKWLINNDFPTQLQVMCWNCNAGRHFNWPKDVCPHQQEVA